MARSTDLGGISLVARLFLSYASENKTWKDLFINDDWFGNYVSPVNYTDYKIEAAPPGSIGTWLRDEMRTADVCVMFLSADYLRKRATMEEWKLALETERDRLFFVPVMMDSASKEWWSKQKLEGRLRGLDSDYAFCDFTHNQKTRLITNDDGYPVQPTTQLISQLARAIKEHLGHSGRMVIRPEPPAIATSPPDPPETAAIPQPATDRPQPPTSHGDVLRYILGHPSAIQPEDVAGKATQLANALTSLKLVPRVWSNGWRRDPGARLGTAAPLAGSDAVLVQPLGPGDAAIHADNPNYTKKWLQAALRDDVPDAVGGIEKCRIIIWLPKGLTDPDFADRVARSADGDEPTFRADAPEELARWLAPAPAEKPKIPVVVLEQCMTDDGPRLTEALQRGLLEVLEKLIEPLPEAWKWSGSMLRGQLANVQGNQAILAIHDMNTNRAGDQVEARGQMEEKFDQQDDFVGRVLNELGRNDLRVFRTALLVQKAEILPWVQYPVPRFGNWFCLPYSDNPGQEPILVPKPDYRDVFRSFLRDWLNESAPA